jgi:hypothetical protein
MGTITICKSDDVIKAIKFPINGKIVEFTCPYFDNFKIIVRNYDDNSDSRLVQREAELSARLCLGFLQQVRLLNKLLVFWILTAYLTFNNQTQNNQDNVIISSQFWIKVIWYQSKIIALNHKQFTNFSNSVKSHLLSYLSSCCQIAAKRRYARLGQIPALKRRYNPEDYIQMCWLKLSNPAIFLSNFKLDSPIPLKAYVTQALFYAIRDEIYKENKAIRQLKFKGYRLLKDGGQKEMKLALSIHFHDSQTIDIDYQIWRAFKEICAPEDKKGKFTEPKDKDFLNISKRFNQRKPADFPEKNQQEVKEILEQCIKALSNYRSNSELYPDSECSENSTSENQWSNIYSQDYKEHDIYTNLEDPIAICLYQAFDYLSEDKNRGLSCEEKAILDAYYGLELTLTNIADLMEKNQSTATRKRQKAIRKLIKNFGEIYNHKHDYQFQDEHLDLIVSALTPSKDKNKRKNQEKTETQDQNNQNRINTITIYEVFDQYLYQVCCYRLYQLTQKVVNQCETDIQLQQKCQGTITKYFLHKLHITLPNNNVELLKNAIAQLVKDWYN